VKRPIYLDHHATTPVDPRVVAAMAPYWSEEFGNASSATHLYGWRAEAAVEQAREELAAAIGAADPREIVFTSGTTESDNLALTGILRAQRGRRDHLVTSAIEHPAVLDTARALAEEGCSVAELPVGEGGRVDPEAVRAAIGERTALVSIGAANSEVGTLQPLAEIAAVCRKAGVPFHTDAAQAVGKVPIDVGRDGIDLLSFCAHKLYGPKGIGALYVRRGRPPLALAPLLHGGGHERGLRSGTTPVPNEPWSFDAVGPVHGVVTSSSSSASAVASGKKLGSTMSQPLFGSPSFCRLSTRYDSANASPEFWK